MADDDRVPPVTTPHPPAAPLGVERTAAPDLAAIEARAAAARADDLDLRFNHIAYALREDPAASGERWSVCRVCGCEGDDPHDPRCPVGHVEGRAPVAPDAELAAIEAREAAATKGPWRVEHGRTYGTSTGAVASVECFVRRPDDDVAIAAEIVDPATGLHSDANAAFIAHAREDIPTLLAHVRRLAAALADSDARVASAVAAERARCAAVCRDIASDATDDDPVSETADECAEAIERASAPTGGAQ